MIRECFYVICVMLYVNSKPPHERGGFNLQEFIDENHLQLHAGNFFLCQHD